MNVRIKKVARKILPSDLYRYISKLRGGGGDDFDFKQPLTKINCGKFEIEIPAKHILVELQKTQPYRDLCMGITAKYVTAKYPNMTIVDIGANVGDTAAIIATYTNNSLILIEPTDYFYSFLSRNSLLLPNKTTIKQCFISDGAHVSGSFHHWGGTSSFNEAINGKLQIKTERLSDIAPKETCFVKLDTDGYDFTILLSSIEWIKSVGPAIIFENQIQNLQNLTDANELIEQLTRAGYMYFVVWDDAGFHLVSTTNVGVLLDLNRYLYKVWKNGGHQSIYNYDVLCLHRKDEDIYKEIWNWYKTY